MRDNAQVVVSVILPTYNESGNIDRMVREIWSALSRASISCEILIVDDNSPDGTAAKAEEMAKEYPVRVHVRMGERGLATAVLKGYDLAAGDICVVMDADLSHPADRLPAMIEPILQGKCDATVGSRYIQGGACPDWSLIRRIVSRGAGLLASGVTDLKDPTSGFMAIRRNLLRGVMLDPVGWKIVLEVIVKTGAKVLEIPIVFRDRQKGKSKLSFKVQLDYVKHLWRLYRYRYRF